MTCQCLRENNNGGSKRAYKWAYDVINILSWCKLNLIHGDQHSSGDWYFTKI